MNPEAFSPLKTRKGLPSLVAVQHHSFGRLWALRGIGVGHHQSDIGSDNAHAFESPE